jgi:cytochrome b561
MPIGNSKYEYGALARLLHWLIALGIFVLLWLGLQQAGMERGPEKLALRETHGSIAVIVFVLMVLRLLWRLANRVPIHPRGMPAWQRGAATLVHWGLYAAVFVQLTSGPMTFATGGRPVPFFGLFSLRLPVAENGDAHEFWEEVHESTWKIIAVLLTIHVLAALYNHFVLKNDVLRRMTIGIPGDVLRD